MLLIFYSITENMESSDSEREFKPFEVHLIKAKRIQPVRKVTDSSWTEERVISLISWVKNHPVLWDPGHVDYKKKSVREMAWQSIAEEFDNSISCQQLNVKWQLLRNQFRAALASIKRTKLDYGVEKTPHWKYYPHMEYIGACESEHNMLSESNLEIVSIISKYQIICSSLFNNCTFFFLLVKWIKRVNGWFIQRRIHHAFFFHS